MARLENILQLEQIGTIISSSPLCLGQVNRVPSDRPFFEGQNESFRMIFHPKQINDRKFVYDARYFSKRSFLKVTTEVNFGL